MRNVSNTEKQENCALCGKKLNFWFTSFKKYEGKKVCTGCGRKLAFEELKANKATRKHTITETKVTCNSCGNVWHYGKQEEWDSIGNNMHNLGKSMMCCGGCLFSMLIPEKPKLDLNKCPKCGSRSIKKEQVVHEVK